MTNKIYINHNDPILNLSIKNMRFVNHTFFENAHKEFTLKTVIFKFISFCVRDILKKNNIILNTKYVRQVIHFSYDVVMPIIARKYL